MTRLFLAALLTILSLPGTLRAQQERKGSGTVVLHAARLIDGTGAPAVANGVVVVAGDRIVAVGREGAVNVPAGVARVELGDATLLPGFIDAHVHLIGRPLGDPGADDAFVRDFQAFGAILGVANAQKTLMAGVTTLRHVRPPHFLDPPPREGIADGPEQVRQAVRYQAKYGAEVIKTCASGGVLSEGDAVGVEQYTFEELKALVDEATKLERKVAAHAHGTESIKSATRAGVASIEHGSFLDEEGARLMARRGTYLVPTLSAGEAVERAARSGVLKGLRAEKGLAAARAMRNGIRLARIYNVPIALGTDAGVGAHGANGHEFTLLVDWGGLTPMRAIMAGTSSAARLLGWDNRIGTLTVGKLADVVAVPGDPLADIHV